MDSPSRPASVSSNTNSAYSHAGSTRHMLSDSNTFHNYNQPSSFNAGNAGGHNKESTDASGLSLTVNYLPSKFSSTLLTPGGSSTRKRKSGRAGDPDPIVPKQGGGVEAFRSGEARMGDDEFDEGMFGKNKGKKRLKWNRFKWVLFVANFLLTGYSLIALVFCLLTWFNVWHHADIVRVANRPELIISTIAASVGVFTSVIGWAGILLNNRSFLAMVKSTHNGHVTSVSTVEHVYKTNSNVADIIPPSSKPPSPKPVTPVPSFQAVKPPSSTTNV
ncbi:hypothetical protein H0H93_009610 [Arthromyces matolae]|nr:hypothetical protein H0H93_009610 [Arthromyces matolae]